MTQKIHTQIPEGWETLVKKALLAQENAYAPYSNFRVGAALEDEHRNTFSGCNVENASFSLTMCAERVAITKMVSEVGVRGFNIAIIGDSEHPTFPCGGCLQVMEEIGCYKVLAINKDATQFTEMDFSELLPSPFRVE